MEVETLTRRNNMLPCLFSNAITPGEQSSFKQMSMVGSKCKEGYIIQLMDSFRRDWQLRRVDSV